MKVLVLGAGIVGVTTAYELARDGHDVTVIDRCEGPALETSHANGGQLSWHQAAPLAGPGVVRKALSWLGKHDAPLLYRLRLDPQLWAWTLKFLSNCPSPTYWHNAERMLRVALYARERLHEILKREDITFDHQRGGILKLYQNAPDHRQDCDDIQAWKELGSTKHGLDHKACIELEPALAHSTLNIAGGIHAPSDESGDCYAFTCQLARRAEALGVTFEWNTTVKGLCREGDTITHAITDAGNLDADLFVMALGSYSPLLMKGLDLKLPIYPAKGYSVTVPIIDEALAPNVSLTSVAHKLVISRFGDTLRVAGMMDLTGYDTDIHDARARVALHNAMKLFPKALNPDQATFWTGLRPQTPDSVPIVGRAKQQNLILNTGHGMLGWTMAPGTARMVADLANAKAPEIDMDGLSWERFA